MNKGQVSVNYTSYYVTDAICRLVHKSGDNISWNTGFLTRSYAC